MKDQLKFKKKKERERRVQKKLLKRRESTLLEKKALADKENQFEKEFQEKTAEPSVEERLRHNMEILKALEDEYNKEMEARKANSEAIDHDPSMSIVDADFKAKMDAAAEQLMLNQKAMEVLQAEHNAVPALEVVPAKKKKLKKKKLA